MQFNITYPINDGVPNAGSHYSSEPTAKNGITFYGKGKIWKKGFFSLGSEKHFFLVSGHSMRWIWKVEGNTMRVPDHKTDMNNWTKRIYWFKGIKVVLNVGKCEFWLKSKRNYKSVENMIFAHWEKADTIAREFSKFARIGLMPLESDHPADCHTAHIVMENKQINAGLVPLLKTGVIPHNPDGVGIETDKSHPNKAEMNGKKSVEGGQGAEYLFTEFKGEFREKKATDEERWRDMEGGMAVLRAESAKFAEGLAEVEKGQALLLRGVRKLIEKED